MNFTLDYLVQKVVPLHGEKPIKEVESLIKSMLEEEMKKQEEEKKK